MRILIYEYVTGGGLLAGDTADLESLRPEGEAMATGLAAEFAALPGVEVHLMRDVRLASPRLPIHLHHVRHAAHELSTLCTLAASADWTILVAPEIDGILLERARLVEQAGARLLSPSSDVIAICTDKRRTAQHLHAAGIPVPRSWELKGDSTAGAEADQEVCYPAVLKRVDGAGSMGTQRIENAHPDVPLPAGRWMLEEFRPGLPVSAGVLCGPRGHLVLPPFVQNVQEKTFNYLGGWRLSDRAAQQRARELARRVADALPGAVGYLGVDLVLGREPSGQEDVVLEVNPRLTTSWVGLRALARSNLAVAMLATAEGAPQSPEFGNQHVRFLSDGTLTGGWHVHRRTRRAC